MLAGFRPNWMTSDKIDSFSGYQQAISTLKGEWIFRGQADSTWGLSPPVERVCNRIWPAASASDLLARTLKFEKFTREEFQRRAEIYLHNRPQPNDAFEWLGLMQHHGVPTRLLDFTRSPFVALFFALNTGRSDASCAVWAIERSTLLKKAVDKLRLGRVKFEYSPGTDSRSVARLANDFLATPPAVQAALAAEPFRLNQRMATQQGLFLMAVGGWSFNDQLEATLAPPKETPRGKPKDANECLRKFDITFNEAGRIDCLRMLQHMNITAEALFPGLDGFAESLEVRFETSML